MGPLATHFRATALSERALNFLSLWFFASTKNPADSNAMTPKSGSVFSGPNSASLLQFGKALSCFDGFGRVGVAAREFPPGGPVVVQTF